MTEVFVVVQGEYSDYRILRIYADKAKAEAFVASENNKKYSAYDPPEIEEHDLCDDLPVSEVTE